MMETSSEAPQRPGLEHPLIAAAVMPVAHAASQMREMRAANVRM